MLIKPSLKGIFAVNPVKRLKGDLMETFLTGTAWF